MSDYDNIDLNECLNLLSDLVLKQGQVVYRHKTDEYGPSGSIYLFEHLYWGYSLGLLELDGLGLIGPFDTLEKAITGCQDEGLNWVHGYTVSIDAPSIPASKLARLLWVEEPPDTGFLLNGEPWIVGSNGNLRRSRKKSPDSETAQER